MARTTWVVLMALLAGGCEGPRPYLIARADLVEQARRPPGERARAQVPAVREADGQPVLIRGRALQLDRASLDLALSQDFDRVRVVASPRNPLIVAGAAILGMGLAWSALVLALPLDYEHRPAPGGEWFTAVGMAGAHLLAGLTLTVGGALRPLIRKQGSAVRPPAY